MSNEREPVMLLGPQLEEARQLVGRILDFVMGEPRWIGLLPMEASADPSNRDAEAKTPAFMLSVLDAATKHEELLIALGNKALISRSFIELTLAKLIFDMTAAMSRQKPVYGSCTNTDERTRQVLRAVAKSRRQRRGDPADGDSPKERGLPLGHAGEEIP